MKDRSLKESVLLISDIFFVLILCFLILFSTLIVTNSIKLNDYTVNGYHISFPMLFGVFLAICIFLGFMISTSLKCYREVKDAYEKEAQHGDHS